MKRRIIQIDKEKCNGCGLCISACHEQALVLIDGKATLISDSYCDGLGDCLPQCPVDAIEIIERAAAAYDDVAVKKRIAENQKNTLSDFPFEITMQNWPLQLQLAPVTASYFDNAHLLIAADCTAFAYQPFHTEMLPNRVCLIGCPKLDEADYQEKLAEIIRQNNIQALTVVRMEVPCCGGIEFAAKKALEASGKNIPLAVETVTLSGELK